MAGKLKELEGRLAADATLKAKFDEALEAAAKAGAKSDPEVLSQAAAAIGTELSPEEIEAEAAAAEQLSDNDLDLVSGGYWFTGKDSEGHDNDCLAAWHCYAALRHTEGGDTTACWSDYHCLYVNVEGVWM